MYFNAQLYLLAADQHMLQERKHL